MKANRSKVLAFGSALLIVTAVIAYFVFMQSQGPVNRLLGRLSSSAVSSISIEAISHTTGTGEIVLEEKDQNKLIELLRKEHYEGKDDSEYAPMTGEPNPNYAIRIQTKDGAIFFFIINPKFCICSPDGFEEYATSKSEVKVYPVSKNGRDAHEQVMDFLTDLVSKYSSK